MIEHICNKCGKKFNVFDEQQNFGFNYFVGYGSKYDGSRIELDLCCKCFDEVVDSIAAQCKFSPFGGSPNYYIDTEIN